MKGKTNVYLTIDETAHYLEIKPSIVFSYIVEGRIRALHDGEHYLINKDQFTTHLKEVEMYRKMIIEYLNEPLPEDIDVKDED